MPDATITYSSLRNEYVIRIRNKVYHIKGGDRETTSYGWGLVEALSKAVRLYDEGHLDMMS